MITRFFIGVSVILLMFPPSSFGQMEQDRVTFFEIQGLYLKIGLDTVIQKFKINNVNQVKDKYGLITEYEVFKRVKNRAVKLRFTGTKNLYHITYTNYYKQFVGRPEDLLSKLVEKYGEPDISYPGSGGSGGSLFACWGLSCSRVTYTPQFPQMTANIYPTGRIRLILADHSIYHNDWEAYKTKRRARMRKNAGIKEKSKEDNVDF